MKSKPSPSGSGLMLVSGGAGFIGSHLAEALAGRGGGRRVRVVDNFLTGKRENLAALAERAERVELIEGDLCDPRLAERACEGAEVVFHLAALPGVAVSMERPLETARHGVLATLNVLAAAQKAGARRVIFSSSSSVYGGRGPFPQREDAEPFPQSPYAAAKLCGEIFVQAHARAFGLDAVILRYFNVYGPRQPLAGPYAAVFPAFITRMLRGEPPRILGDGRQTRDFTYVGDAVRANVLAAECPQRLAGEVLNIAGGKPASVLELAAAINCVLGTSLEPVFGPERPGDVRASWADLSRARERIGYAPQTGLEEGLRRTVAYWTARETG